MSTALAERPTSALAAPAVTPEQLELVTRTVAQGATPDELKLYLYDCQRQGVHPLDKLIHFTKREGRYTPITSIDFMRIRAAETGEYAGSDDAVFPEGVGPDGDHAPFQATVTVWRLVHGVRCPFTATARWSEYKPAPGPSGKADSMWRKMPHTMLAKCAEALALRKGFPRQLAGLYAKEELDQAGSNGYVVEAPSQPAAVPPVAGQREPSVPNGGDLGHPPYHSTQNHRPEPELPAGAVLIKRVDTSPTKNPNVQKAFITLSTGEQVTTIKTQLIALCEQLCSEQIPVTVETKQTKWGTDLIAVHRVAEDLGEPEPPPLTDDDIPF